MTSEEFLSTRTRLGLSRAAFCRALGIAENSGTAYELGRRPIPKVVALASSALLYGLPPVGGRKIPEEEDADAAEVIEP